MVIEICVFPVDPIFSNQYNWGLVVPSVCYQYYGELVGFSLSVMIVLTNKFLSYKDFIDNI